MILLTEAEDKSSILSKTEAEDSVDPWCHVPNHPVPVPIFVHCQDMTAGRFGTNVPTKISCLSRNGLGQFGSVWDTALQIRSFY